MSLSDAYVYYTFGARCSFYEFKMTAKHNIEEVVKKQVKKIKKLLCVKLKID